MKTIYLNTGELTFVDDEDFAFINQWRWAENKGGYAQRGSSVNGKKVTVLMHRVIMGAKKGQSIDHVNGDGFDNRKVNLRIATQSQNMHNRKMGKNNTSGYKGVSWSEQAKKWRAMICHNRKPLSLGMFNSAREAAIAYNHAATELFGEFAKLNKI